MAGGNGRRRKEPKNAPTALTRCARNASFAAVMALDAFASAMMGNMPLAVTRARSSVEWLREALREAQSWLENVDK